MKRFTGDGERQKYSTGWNGVTAVLILLVLAVIGIEDGDAGSSELTGVYSIEMKTGAAGERADGKRSSAFRCR